MLSSAFLSGILESPKVPDAAKQAAKVQLSKGVPFVSNKELRTYLEQAGADEDAIQFLAQDNVEARVKALQTALAFVALVSIIALFFTGRLPKEPAGEIRPAGEALPASARAP